MSQIVVVTGGSGFIGSEVVKQLLEKGYEVRATVRDPNNATKVAHLTALADALPGKLTLHAADLLKDGSFDEVVGGAHFVFHTASPFQTSVEDPKRDLIDPAVKGTENVLSSVAKSKHTVKRVVLTSSIAAVRSTKAPATPKNGELYTPEDFNESSTIDSEPYPLSKVLAEKAAWALAKKEGLDLVTVNPCFVIGPVISARTDATSIQLLKAVLEGGESLFSKGNLWYVDVRDVALAHVRAAEVPSARGRYFAAPECSFPGHQLIATIRDNFPGISTPEGAAGQPIRKLDNSKIREELGIRLIPEAESLVDMARTLVSLGVAKPTFT